MIGVTTDLPKGRDFPIVVQPRSRRELLDFAEEWSQSLETAVSDHGAVLLRGFDVPGEAALSRLFERLWSAPSPYIYRSTPRQAVAPGVYTATEYPADREIPLHNENAYQRDWPMRIGFHCVVPAAAGGQTPLADSVKITARIGTDLVSDFGRRGVRYIRNYGEAVDLPWQVVFQTESHEVVETYCAEHDISFEWIGGDLRTYQVCQGTAVHPKTGGEIWFNQAHLFHVSALGQEIAADMLAVFGSDGLPRQAQYGDGAEFESPVMDHIRDAFAQERVTFDWQAGDILLLDNMRICHGRLPFAGARRVLVSMGLPRSTLVGSVQTATPAFSRLAD